MNVKEEADQLLYARNHGLPIFGETCPQYLLFTEKELEREDGKKWICSPPVRLEKDNDGLWNALADGTIDVISTDHCPFLYDGTKPIMYQGKPYQRPGKELGRDDFSKTPGGVPGVGDRMSVIWTKGVVEGKLSPTRFVEVMSTNPAKIFGLYPQKGSLNPGSDADIVIWILKRLLNTAFQLPDIGLTQSI
jgi:dihydropyrimidinase